MVIAKRVGRGAMRGPHGVVHPNKVVAKHPFAAKVSNVTIEIGCSLPHGLTLEVGAPGEENYHAVVLVGLNAAPRGSSYGVTRVPADLWLTWVAEHNTMRYLADGSVFVIEGEKRLQPLSMRPLPPPLRRG